MPGVDYNASFDVPVFRTGSTGPIGPAKVRLPPPEPREPADFVSTQTGAGRELYFGRFRVRGLAMQGGAWGHTFLFLFHRQKAKVCPRLVPPFPRHPEPGNGAVHC